MIKVYKAVIHTHFKVIPKHVYSYMSGCDPISPISHPFPLAQTTSHPSASLTPPSQAGPSTRCSCTRRPTSGARPTRPRRTAPPCRTSSVCERSTPARSSTAGGSSTSCPIIAGASTSWRRASTASPVTGVPSARPCSPSGVSQSDLDQTHQATSRHLAQCD